jgi:outer membrane biosynthesis protein TonB
MLSTATTQAGSTKAAPSLPSPPSAGPGSNKSPAAARPRRDITASKAIASRETVDADAARVPAIIAYETLRAPLMPSVFESTTPTSSAALDDADPAKAIYSRVDADVQPPVMLYPQMPPPLIVGTASEGIVNSMELVIATDGSVERVRLVSEPRRMADMMLLSGAKLWRFSPAVKDGEPVRYRTTLSWTVFP